MTPRRLQLVWSLKKDDDLLAGKLKPPTPVLKVAFASDDRQRVNQHFGSTKGFITYNVTPKGAAVTGFAEFPEEAMDGNENKLTAKVDFLEGCAAVFVMAIGASAIKLLLSKGIQPIRIGEEDDISTLLLDVSKVMREGGVAWVDSAVRAQLNPNTSNRFDQMLAEGWDA